jgi:hypothetical protein
MAKTKPETRQRAVKQPVVSTPSRYAKFLPYIAAFVTFIVITLVFFSPMIMGDKVLPQGDINQFNGAAKEIMDFREKNHTEPLWTNSMFGGMPAFQISTAYPANLIQYVEKVVRLGLPEFTGYLFAACVGFYLLLLVMGINPWLSIAGAIAYSLATYNLIIIDAGHNTKMHTIALLPYVVVGFMLLWNRRYLLGAAVSALSFAMLIGANHIQIAYYLFITLLIAGFVFLVYASKVDRRVKLALVASVALSLISLFLFSYFGRINKVYFYIFEISQLVATLIMVYIIGYSAYSLLIKKDPDIKHYILVFGIFAGAGLIGIASNLSMLWTTYEYGNATIRGKSDLTSNTQSKGGLDRDYAFGWSYGKAELFNLMIPNFMGGSSNQMMDEDSKTVQAIHGQSRVLPMYWGDQPFTSGPAYLGALMVFFFVLGLILVDGPFKWWLGIATFLAMLLATGHNSPWFNNAFFQYFPGYNKFRTVTMALIICQFTVPLLAILAFSRILNKEVARDRALNGLYIAGGITGGICLIFALTGPSLFHFTGSGDAKIQEELVSYLRQDRQSLMRMDALRSFVLILIGAGVVWAIIQDKLSKNLAIGIVIAACLFDYIGVGKRFINNDSFAEQSEKQERFAKSPVDEAILKDKSLDYRVLNTSVNIFNDASTSYYHKSVGGYHAAKLRRYQELIENQISKYNTAVLDMLNTKYVIQKGPNGQPAPTQNPGACGNAWFVNKVQLVKNADEEIKALDKFDPLETAFVDEKFSKDLTGYTGGKDTASKITLKSYEPNDLKYEYTAPKQQVAVFSEIYYQPGWVATVDGNETPIFRANYVLRAMLLPAGSHKVEMKFRPKSYYTGEKVALASSALILILLAGAIFVEYKNKKSSQAQPLT